MKGELIIRISPKGIRVGGLCPGSAPRQVLERIGDVSVVAPSLGIARLKEG